MAGTSKILSVRIDWAKHDRIVAVAADHQRRPADIVREAIDAYLSGAAIMSHSHLRMARITEFIQVAIDIMIREQYPELRDRIVAEADKRVGMYHGA